MDVKKVTECIDYIKKSMEKKTQADPEQSAHSDGDAKLENSFAVLHEAMMRLAASSHVMLPQPKPRLKLSSDTVRALRSLLAVIRSMEKDIEHSPQQKAELEEAVFRAVSAMDPTRTVKSNAGDSEPNAEGNPPRSTRRCQPTYTIYRSYQRTCLLAFPPVYGQKSQL
jgi:hypothetical protein